MGMITYPCPKFICGLALYVMAYVGNYGIDTVDHVANTWWQVHHFDYD